MFGGKCGLKKTMFTGPAVYEFARSLRYRSSYAEPSVGTITLFPLGPDGEAMR
jgi:hypothetical protein